MLTVFFGEDGAWPGSGGKFTLLGCNIGGLIGRGRLEGERLRVWIGGPESDCADGLCIVTGGGAVAPRRCGAAVGTSLESLGKEPV